MSYEPSGYVPSEKIVGGGCNGYWAYYKIAVAAELRYPSQDSTQSGTSVDCSLKPGWNLVGNPFFDVAALPSGIGSYFWDTSVGDYVVRDSIEIGGANWVFARSSATLMLTAQ